MSIKPKTMSTRALVSIAFGGAIAFVLMLFNFNLPLVPEFIKLDISDLPPLILAFAYGPLAGILTELIKNLLHLTQSSTMGVGELSNFLLGSIFVTVSSLIYQRRKNRKHAIIGMLFGSAALAIGSIFTNYFLIFPFYTNVMGLPMDAIVAMGTKISPILNNEFKLILLSVAPFNLFKGLLISFLTFLLYKRLSPILKNKA